MKKKIWIILGIILAVLIAAVVFVCTKKYWVTKEETYYPYYGAIDVYNASREELIEFDLCGYTKSFSEVKNERQAAEIANEVIKEVYGEEEYPYIVKFNENANAWVVHGSLPRRFFQLGGVGTVAIDKNTGEVLMLLHTK